MNEEYLTKTTEIDETVTLTEETQNDTDPPTANEVGSLQNNEEDSTDVIDNDLSELKEEFPELSNLKSVSELSNPIRYAALRDLGLSPAEAYILTARKRVEYDNRSHLTSSVPVSAKSPGCALSSRELNEMREIFGEISDLEIHKLYKKVTK